MSENYPHPVNISPNAIARLKEDVANQMKSLNGDGYSYSYDPSANSALNVSESMKMDALRLKQSPTATDLAKRAGNR